MLFAQSTRQWPVLAVILFTMGSAACKPSTDNHPPVLTVSHDAAQVTQGYAMKPIRITATDEDGDALELLAAGLPGGAKLKEGAEANTWSLEYTPSLKGAYGSYLVILSLSDGVSDELVTRGVRITVAENQKPIFDMLSDKSTNEDDGISFIVHAVDPERTLVTYSMITNLPSATLDPTNGTFNAPGETNAPGNYSVTFRATDGDGRIGEMTLNLHIEDVNHAPKLTSSSPAGAETSGDETPESNFKFQIAATDRDGDTLAYDWRAQIGTNIQPIGASAQTLELKDVISALHPEDETDITLTARAADPLGANVERQWTLHYKQKAVYVVFSATSEPAEKGALWSPIARLADGMAKAQVLGKTEVRIAAGNHVGAVKPLSGITLKGGFSASDWSRNPTANVTKLQVLRTGVEFASVKDVELSGFTIVSEDAVSPGQSSYGVRVIDSIGVILRNNTISGGRGANGTNGVDGTPGLGGASGQPGKTPSGGSASSSLCGIGGAGGQGSTNHGVVGGLGGDGSGGTAPGTGGIGGFKEGFGGNGGSGGNGPIGTSGSSGSADGIFTGNEWVPTSGTNGEAGSAGGAGGGGGGGGAVRIGNPTFYTVVGGGGGSGGTGGCGGGAGTGGTGGGGSFGIFVIGASSVIAENNTIQTTSGGNGGNGGAGGSGGIGGIGGQSGSGEINGSYSGGRGGAGGSGGTGGRGGSGGAGAGGPSVGIVNRSVIEGGLTNSSNTFSIGLAGKGGSAEGATASNGTYAEIW